MMQGLLGFDENHRLVVYDQKCQYPVVGLWTTGIDLGNIFLKNQINDKVKQQIRVLMMNHAQSSKFSKVSFSSKKFKFLYLPFPLHQMGVPSVFIVEMDELNSQITTKCLEGKIQIQESIPISLTSNKSKNQKSQLWENFLNKDSQKQNKHNMDTTKLQNLDERINLLSNEYEQIQNMFNMKNNNIQQQEDQINDNINQELDIQTSQKHLQFQRLLLEQSTQQVFTTRSNQSNQLNTTNQKALIKQDSGIASNRIFNQAIKLNNDQNKFSSFKKLNNSIYETLGDNTTWLSMERKNQYQQLTQTEVNSFFIDLPNIQTSS